LLLTYERVARLPLRVEKYSLEGRSHAHAGFDRHTTIVRLIGAGAAGVGEDVVWDAETQARFRQAGAALPLAGSWTLDSFSERLGSLELFPGREPSQAVYRNYRRWAFESAALDLALRQAEQSIAQALERLPAPVRFVVSSGLGHPPTFEPCARRIAAYPRIRFKLDATPAWSAALIRDLAGSGAVEVIDFKGAYHGTVVDVGTDPVLYRSVAEGLPGTFLEDPDLTVAGADAALVPHRDRITWDAPIHSAEDIRRLPFVPAAVNMKPSRFGSLRALFEAYDFCAQEKIPTYGGGQAELGPGRGHIQILAALFHPDEPNDVAPSGYDWIDFPEDLPPSPLAPNLEPVGFARKS
jgi:hypothetical protein